MSEKYPIDTYIRDLNLYFCGKVRFKVKEINY